MARKIGEEFVNDMIDRGRREIGSLFYGESNVAQPMYPLRGSYSLSKEADRESQANKPSFEELHPAGPARDDPDRDRGFERE